MSGGGGGGGNQNITSTVTQKTDPPEYVKPYATALLSGGSQIASQPYQPYTGMAVAPLADETQAGMYMAAQRAAMGSPVLAAANQSAVNTMGGNDLAYGMGLASQPQGQQIAAMQAPGGRYEIGGNPLASIGTNPVGSNRLLGMQNPYLAEQIRYAQAEMLPQLGYMSREGGSYGNSGMNEAIAKSMGQVASDMRMQDYGLQANLGESDLARRNAAWEAAAGRGMDVWAGEEGRKQQAYEADMMRQMAGWESSRNAQQAAFENTRNAQLDAWSGVGNRGLQAMQMAPQLAGEDYTDARMLMGVGDAKKAYQQSLIDNAMGQWDAAQQWPYSQYDWFANLMRGAGWGTYGTGSSSTTQPNPNQQSGLANYLGGGLSGLGLLTGLFGGG